MAKDGIDLPINIDTEQARAAVKGFEKTAVDSFGRVSKSTNSLQDSFENTGKKVLAFAAAFLSFRAVKGLLLDTVSAFADFEQATLRVSALSKGTATEIDLISEAAKQLALQFGGGVVDQVDAYYEAVSSGAAIGANTTDLLTEANKLSIGSVTDLTTTIKGLVSVQSAYGKDTVRISEISNAFFGAAKGGLTTVGQLADAMGQISPQAAAAGISVNEVFSAISALTSTGIKTTESVTKLRAAMTSIFKPTEEMKKAFKKLGIENVELEIRQKGLVNVLKRLSDSAGGSLSAINKLAGSSEAAAAIISIAGNAYETFNKTLETVTNNTELATEGYDIQSRSLQTLFNRAKAVYEILFINIGQDLKPLAVGFISLAIDIGNSFGDIISDAKAAKKSISDFFGIIDKERFDGLTASQKKISLLKEELQELQEGLPKKQAKAALLLDDENVNTLKAYTDKIKELSFEIQSLGREQRQEIETTKALNDIKKKAEEVEKRLIKQQLEESILSEKIIVTLTEEQKEYQKLMNQKAKLSDSFIMQKRDEQKEVRDILKKESEDEAKAIEDSLKAQQEYQDKLISSSISGGFKGVAAAFLTDVSPAIGQAFTLLAQDSAAFANTLEELFSVDFIGNVIKNAVKIVSKLPELITNAVKDIPEQIFDSFLDSFSLSSSVSDEVIKSEEIIKEFNDNILAAQKATSQAAVDARSASNSKVLEETRKFENDVVEINANAYSKKAAARDKFNADVKTLQAKLTTDLQKEQERYTSEVEKIEGKKQSILDKFRDEELRKEQKRFDDANSAYDKAIDARLKIEDKIKSVEEKIADQNNKDKIAQVDVALFKEQSILTNAASERADIEKTLGDSLYALRFESDQAQRDLIQTQIDDTNALLETAKANEAAALEEFNARKTALNTTYNVEEATSLATQLAALQAEKATAVTAELTALDAFNVEKKKRDDAEVLEKSKQTADLARLDGELVTARDTNLKNIKILRDQNNGDYITLEMTTKNAIFDIEDEKNKTLIEKEKTRNSTILGLYSAFHEDIKGINEKYETERATELAKIATAQAEKIAKEQATIKASQDKIEPVTLTSGSSQKGGTLIEKAVAGFKNLFGFAEGGIVPGGFNNDTFPARLSSGELVVPKQSTDALFNLINGLSDNMNKQNNVPRETQSGGGSQNVTVILQLGEQQLATAMLNLNRQGLRVA